MYGKGASYHRLVGREATYSLATMVLNNVDGPQLPEAEFDEEQRQTLSEWVAKYDSKYDVVGVYVAGATGSAAGGEEKVAVDGVAAPGPPSDVRPPEQAKPTRMKTKPTPSDGTPTPDFKKLLATPSPAPRLALAQPKLQVSSHASPPVILDLCAPKYSE